MSYLDHIRFCNDHDMSQFVPFRVSGRTLGWVREDFREELSRYGDVLDLSDGGVDLFSELNTPSLRTEAMADVLGDLHQRGLISGWRNENYPVVSSFGATPVLVMERAGVPRFGVQAFGVHLNGFVRTPQGLKMWIGRRSKTKEICPGMLDNMVAGGQPFGLSLQENLIKECAEEADLPESLAAKAIPVGSISYVMEVDNGLKPDVMFCYDLELPSDFVPRNTDGELEEFYLWPVEQVAEVVRTSFEFKFNCNLVIIDFLIRHGIINPDREPHYQELVKCLRGQSV